MVGVTRCSAAYWLIFFALFPLTLVAAYFIARYVINMEKLRKGPLCLLLILRA